MFENEDEAKEEVQAQSPPPKKQARLSDSIIQNLFS
jgi:hypothetical protein